MNLSELIVDFVAECEYSSLSHDVRKSAQVGLIDTLGVAIIGSQEPGARVIREVAAIESPMGSVTAVGTGVSTTACAAAWVNGYAAHCLDYDDSQHRVGTHMSAPVVAAALAVAESEQRSGRDLIAAYVAGFEVGCHLGRLGGLSRHLTRIGVHATGYLGHLGAAMAAGKLMGLGRQQLIQALGVAASHASGLVRSFGTMSKAQNAGNAARNGTLSAVLAKEGFTAPTNILDGKRGLYSLHGVTVDFEEVSSRLGKEFEVQHNTLKEYACAGWRNPIVEASILLATANNLNAEDIEEVVIRACHDRSHLPDYPDPRSGLESKFSVSHAVAAGIVDRAGGIAQFADDKVFDPAFEAIRRRVKLVYDDSLQPYQVIATVKSCSGDEFEHFVPTPKGDHARPLTWNEIIAKFTANVFPVLPQDNVEALVRMGSDLESVEVVNDLLMLCRST